MPRREDAIEDAIRENLPETARSRVTKHESLMDIDRRQYFRSRSLREFIAEPAWR